MLSSGTQNWYQESVEAVEERRCDANHVERPAGECDGFTAMSGSAPKRRCQRL